MNQDHLSRPTRALFAAVGIALMSGAVLAAGLAAVPGHEGSHRLKAAFDQAGQGLDTHSEVKIRGVEVGRVTSVDLAPDGRAVVGLRIDDGVRIPVSAEATVEAVSVFGPKDVVIEPGEGEGIGPFLDDGMSIARTVEPIDPADTARPAYELANAFDPAEFGALLDTFSQAVSGRGEQLGRTVDNSAEVLDVMAGSTDVTRGLLQDAGDLAETFGDRGESLASTAADADALLATAGTRPERYTALLDQAIEASDEVTAFLRDNRENTRHVVDAGTRAAAVLNAQLKNLPVLVDGLADFFGLVGGIMREKAPHDTLMGSADIVLPTDVCQIVLDLCPARGGRR
ncbi:MCE family protein [Actinocorallia populi]|uniref:MCE family protein n=1 Tax=Actinocorallia populi TaxID=2079200 RepID=UPI000D08B04A|nr:MlaD family protein [Actinocorallia populi]